MQELIQATKKALCENKPLPFSVYSSIKEQHILNVPVIKPLLIVVLAGIKQLGINNEIVCPAGTFIFLSNNPTINMRNIPNHEEYFALLIEFDHGDFNQFKQQRNRTRKYNQGEINTVLAKVLQQYVEWSVWAPPEAGHWRKGELLQLLYLQGHEDIAAMAGPPSLSHVLHDMMSDNIADEWSVERVTAKLAISESTLRRKLKAEGTDIQTLRDRTKLGHGLNLLQTTADPIGQISDRCGYDSQSRFTHKFKQLFGITPSELRKTRRSGKLSMC